MQLRWAGVFFHAGERRRSEGRPDRHREIEGKPDCLIRTAEGVVPLEFKRSKKAPARGEVCPNHRIQNLAYCALVEDQMRVRVPYGLVIYAGRQVRRVDYTDARPKLGQDTTGTVHKKRRSRSNEAVSCTT